MASVSDSGPELDYSGISAASEDPAGRTNSNGKRPAPRGTAAYPRKRAVTACQVCRARRTKCDNRKPSCSFCLKVGAQCVQSPVDLSSFDPASLKILERLDEIERLVKQQKSAQNAGSELWQRPRTALPNTVQSLHLPSYTNTVSATSHSPASNPPSKSNANHSRNDSLLPLPVEEVLKWPEFHTGESARPRSPAPHAFTTRIEDPKLTRDDVKPLIDNFFEEVHMKNPIFNEFVTRQMISTLMSNPELDDSPESCIALLIFALGSLSPPFRRKEVPRPNHPHEIARFLESMVYFQAAQKRLGVLMATGGVVEAQCLFLSGVFMMIIFRTTVAWRYFLQALACCQGFASSITEDPEIGLTEAQQAIYWTAWKSEWELRVILRIPDFPAADHARYPPFFPTPPETLNEEGALGSSITRRQNRAWYFYLTEISLRRITTRIMQLILEQEPQPGQTMLAALAAQVPHLLEQQSEWAESISHIFRLETSPTEDDVCMFILRGHHANLTEIIHWPFIYSAIDGTLPDSSFYKDDVHTMTLWNLANRGLVEHVSRITVNRPGFRLQHHGTLGMVASCARSAVVLVKAAIMAKERSRVYGETSIQVPTHWYTSVAEVLQLLEYWVGQATQMKPWLAGLRAGLERHACL